MMHRKTDEEMARTAVGKTTRTLVRLKHSLAADEELNTLLPDTLEEFDAALAAGELKNVRTALDDILAG